ncbi:LADA_0B04720g1_1 [Lachancea dasiensis]|uniref:LADA_0B04720g1_1 n=1 Tax=Lachancea dasiensis TaxID=1072105 RepID=A0A1G4IT41_9SACH|nr:LADA_0B04720g1_1 [Lachancea dasiensis]
MEKFTNWRDKGTGIAPFLPTPPPLSQEKGFEAFGNNVRLIIKLVCTIPIVLLALITPASISKPLWRIIMQIVCGWNVQVAIQGVKRRDQQDKLPCADEIYVVNYSSPLDCLALWFLARGSVSFCIPIVREKAVHIVQLSFWQFITFTLNNGQVNNNGTLLPEVTDPAKHLKGRVCYVFAEGTTSNGKSILPFALTQLAWDEFINRRYTSSVGVSSSSSTGFKCQGANSARVQTIHLKINGSLTTPLKVGFWRYLVRASTQGVTYKCKISEPVGPDLAQIRTSLAGGDKFKLVGRDLNLESKRKFVQEFGDRRN